MMVKRENRSTRRKKPVQMSFRPQQIPHGLDFMGDNVTSIQNDSIFPVGTILPLLHTQHLILPSPSAIPLYQLTPSLQSTLPLSPLSRSREIP